MTHTTQDTSAIIAVLHRFGCYGFEAVEIASYLLKRAHGDVKIAKELAANPYKLNGRNIW